MQENDKMLWILGLNAALWTLIWLCYICLDLQNKQKSIDNATWVLGIENIFSDISDSKHHWLFGPEIKSRRTYPWGFWSDGMNSAVSPFPTKNNWTREDYLLKICNIFWNCPEDNLKKNEETFIKGNLLYLSKKSEGLWHLSHTFILTLLQPLFSGNDMGYFTVGGYSQE